MQNRLQINPFTINELSPIGFIAERWEFHENKRVGNKIKIPFSFLGLGKDFNKIIPIFAPRGQPKIA